MEAPGRESSGGWEITRREARRRKNAAERGRGREAGLAVTDPTVAPASPAAGPSLSQSRRPETSSPSRMVGSGTSGSNTGQVPYRSGRKHGGPGRQEVVTLISELGQLMGLAQRDSAAVSGRTTPPLPSPPAAWVRPTAATLSPIPSRTQEASGMVSTSRSNAWCAPAGSGSGAVPRERDDRGLQADFMKETRDNDENVESLAKIGFCEGEPEMEMSRCGHNLIPRRPQVGCYYGDAVKLEQQEPNETVESLFRQAIALLPIDDMPNLLKFVIGGGACFGLLDPISNIILSGISFLDRDEHPSEEELIRRSTMTNQQLEFEACKSKIIMDCINQKFVEETGLSFSVGRSMKGLTVFLENYFRYLTEEQAVQYLKLAGFDLTLAIMLIDYDRLATEKPFSCTLNLSSNKTLAALKQAASEARLWAPADDFVLLATSSYPRDLLEKATSRLLKRKKLHPSDIKQMLKLMQWRSRHVPDEDDPNFAHLTVLRHPEDLATKATYCSESVLSIPRSPSSHCPLSCAYHRGLKLQLLDSIHLFYVEALARLPLEFLHKHLRGIMIGGNCFGPLDPVSNIILNAIWFDMSFPLEDVQNEEADVLDTRSFLRMEKRSLEGLIILCDSFFSYCNRDPVGFEHRALEYLSSTKCDVYNLLTKGPQVFNAEICKQNFTKAAIAAKHPQSAHLGEFLGSLCPRDIHDCMMHLFQCGESFKCSISSSEVEQIYSLIRTFRYQEISREPASILSPRAWKVLDEIKNRFRVEQFFVRKVINLKLQEYNSSRSKLRVYKLHAICGVAASYSCSGRICYHVNFLARTDCDGCVLFFSEFFGFSTFNEKITFIQDKLRPSFCCPVLISYDLGRCCRCEKTASKIVHPTHREYVSSNGKDSAYSFPILNTIKENVDVDMALELDFIYFDHKRDSHLVQYLNKLGTRPDSWSSAHS